MIEVHETITTPRTTYVQPPPADSTPTQIANSTTLNTEPVTSSVINSPDDAEGTGSTDGTSALPPPYTPGDVFTQNPQLVQFRAVNAP